MLIIKKDITTITIGIIAHGCNCSGGFGSGVAGAIKRKWPLVYEKYHQLVNGQNHKLLGSCQLIEIVSKQLYVVNCFTQIFYGNDKKTYANIEAIDRCLEELYKYSEELNLPVYIPKIGCGLGGLNWDDDVKPLIEAKYTKMDISVCEI